MGSRCEPSWSQLAKFATQRKSATKTTRKPPRMIVKRALARPLHHDQSLITVAQSRRLTTPRRATSGAVPAHRHGGRYRAEDDERLGGADRASKSPARFP